MRLTTRIATDVLTSGRAQPINTVRSIPLGVRPTEKAAGARRRPLSMDRAPGNQQHRVASSAEELHQETHLRRVHLLLTAGVVGMAALAILPESAGIVVYLTLSTVMVAVAGSHARHLDPPVRRPAIWMITAGGSSLLGTVVRGAESIVTGESYPFPSFADALTILSYCCFIGAVIFIIWKRVGRPDLDLVIDALVAAVAVALLQWQLVLLPTLDVATADPGGVVLNIVYSILSIVLVASAIGISIAGGHRSTSNRFLAGSLTGIVLLDLTAALVTTGQVPAQLRLLPAAAVFVLGAAGLIHPSVSSLLRRPSSRAHLRRLTYTRIVVLGLALVVPPALIAVTVLDGGRVTLWLPLIGAFLLTPMVVVRLGRLVQRNALVADIESAVRSLSEDLVSAASVDEIGAIAARGVTAVTGSKLGGPEFVVVEETPRSTGVRPTPGGHPATAPLIQAAVAARRREGSAPASGEIIELGVPGWAAVAVVTEGRLRGAALIEPSSLSIDQIQAVQTVCRDAALALRSMDRTERTVQRRSEERFGALVDNSSDIIVILDAERRPVYVSPVAARLLGYPLDYLDRLDVTELVHPSDAGVLERFEDSVAEGQRLSFEVRLRHLAGTYHWFELIGVDLSDDPNVAGMVITAREIGDRKSAEDQLVLSEARFKALVQHSSDVILAVLPDGELRYASPSVEVVTGRGLDDLHSVTISEIFPSSGIDWGSALRTTAQASDGRLHFWFDDAGGRRRHIEATVRDLRAEPAIGAFVLNGRDVTERTAMVDRLEYQASHDPLTGLANRNAAGVALAGMLNRNPGRSTLAVIAIDMNDFKDVNDSLGHATGDRVLTTVAQRLAREADAEDVVARSNGDEFLFIVERARGEEAVLLIAQRLIETVSAPIVVDDRTVTLSAAAGVAFDHDRSNSAEDLLRAADTAMYRSKVGERGVGRARIVTFEPSMHIDSMALFELRGDLAAAIANDQLEAHYQPVVDLCTQRIIGLEALARWEHPTRGSLSPGVFIPIAEEHGLIAEIGRCMRRRACRDLAEWRLTQSEATADLTVAVNVAAAELGDDEFVESIRELLSEFALPPGCLTLELTESSLLTETEVVRSRMEALSELGVRLAIDDFGTGYSSLGYIHRFSFDVLKIDRSFVSALEHATNRQIITAVTELAAQLQAAVVAEGIETVEQESVLSDLGVELGQGFLYSRPVPADAILRLLSAQQIDLT
ncbi:MAG: EAL domain-containing protein [Actinobacteria bacterium]|nr:EAL domain-containing protein [Actinomycetota bacterium]